ncbi:hypothetical protein [Stenotrophomonas sp. VV52]|uniref:hypothetical protein n=1 Tax=Stenotrophomonas sp. VV52 TaxID=2066958 RepID=UPI000C9E20A1|nr:hypothetical protein [Stenotrophomonas sp. VV52]
MDRINRLVLGLALATFAAPAAASDFRGFFSLFLAAPFLAGVMFFAAFILARRASASASGLRRFAPLALLVPALMLMSLICLVFSTYALVAFPLLCIALFLLSSRIWFNPIGRVSIWFPRVLALLAVAAGAFMAWDMHLVVKDGMKAEEGVAVVMLGAVFFMSLGACLFAGRRPAGR